jgi:two-component system, chemotaxis family, protein-glutamate methylesterase/glutaminase
MDERVRVLVVDDSSFVRTIVSRKLASDPGIEVVGTASDGIEALEKVKELQPQVITLDVMMPNMDGLTFLERIMADNPIPVVMLSALTREGADITMKAIEMGAVDFILKPSVLSPVDDNSTAASLMEKIKAAGHIKVKARKAVASQSYASYKVNGFRGSSNGHLKTLIIGTSTGGPKALMQVIPNLPRDLPAQVLVVQHMPPLFTKSLAERLDNASQLSVKEAKEGDRARQGQVLLAPGDYHMTISRDGKISLNQNPPRWGVRPSVDATMESVAEVFGSNSLGVVMTGMGVDGTKGSSMIKSAGGSVLVEDESTCAVYGMPMSVANAGYADAVVPLHNMAAAIVRYCAGE